MINRRRSSRYYDNPTNGISNSKLATLYKSFIEFDANTAHKILAAYGEKHGAAVLQYALDTYPQWKSQTTNMSDKTLQKLAPFIYPFLGDAQKADLIRKILRPNFEKIDKTIRIDVNSPQIGTKKFNEAVEFLSEEKTIQRTLQHVYEEIFLICSSNYTIVKQFLPAIWKELCGTVDSNSKIEIDKINKILSAKKIIPQVNHLKLVGGNIKVVMYKDTSKIQMYLFVGIFLFWLIGSILVSDGRSYCADGSTTHSSGRGTCSWHHGQGTQPEKKVIFYISLGLLGCWIFGCERVNRKNQV